MWQAAIPAAASAFGAMMQYQGAQEANETNIRLSQENRDFQERMSNTAYQRATKDMISAGLSPMLAYSQGGASSPAGGAAVVQNTKSHMATSARDVGMATLQAENVQATTAREKTQADLNVASAEESRARAHELRSDTASKDQGEAFGGDGPVRTLRDLTRAMDYKKLTLDTGLTGTHINELTQRIWNMKTTQRLTNAQILETMKGMELKAAQIFLHEMEMPGARNKAHSDSTWWGRNVRPYFHEGTSAINSAASLYRLRQGDRALETGRGNLYLRSMGQ